jgi:chromosome segregation ATPase
VSRLAPPITRRHYPEEATVAPTQEARVEVLEVKVQTLEEKVENLETNAGPGRADAQSGNLAGLRRQFAEFGEVQAKQSRTLDIHTAKISAIDRASDQTRLEVHRFNSEIRNVREEFSGRLERLDNDVAGLRREIVGDDGLLVSLNKDMFLLRDDVTGIKVKVDTLQVDVSGLKTDVSALKTDVAGLKTDVSALKTDVAGLKTDVSQLKTDMAEVKGSLKEILDRLPAKAA